MRPPNGLTPFEALRALGLEQKQVAEITHRDLSWPAKTAAFHELVRSTRKSRLRECHPDVCTDADATEQAQAINVAADYLLTISLGPRTRPRAPVHIIFPGMQPGMHGVRSVRHEYRTATGYRTTVDFHTTGDMVEQMMRDMMGIRDWQAPRNPPPYESPGEDETAEDVIKARRWWVGVDQRAPRDPPSEGGHPGKTPQPDEDD